ncbi:MAG TPA: 3-phosphoshikimate 1-carboxyvinyltransferase [Pyrinomonadaceae bacterium]|nr:3-phosphoshikimate 1-carboxyvinyltransferase [Pyrinomonadaceae bacterium]
MRLSPAQRIRGRLRLPGDKSISHRAALIGAMADEPFEISNFSTARDCASTLSCLRDLGVSFEHKDGKVRFAGAQNLESPVKALDCGNSGSTMRMLAGVLAGHDITAELVGDESLSSRPMRRIIEPLELMGAKIEATGGKPPLRIRGCKKPNPIAYELPVASAQVKSAILFAGLNADGRTTVIERSPSRDHTERLFNGFGVAVNTNDDLTVTLDGPSHFSGGAITIPGDISSAAYFIAAAVMLPGSELVIEGVGLNPTRSAFLSVLRSWGADISTTDFRMERNEPVGTITVRGGIGEAEHDADRVLGGNKVPLLIDELPLLAVVGTQVPGGIEIRDAAELRLKESDRLAATAQNLRAMKANVEETADGLHVLGPTKLRGALIDSFGDHRIAMAFSIAALLADGETQIRGSESAAVSFPEFFELLHSVTERGNLTTRSSSLDSWVAAKRKSHGRSRVGSESA